MLDNNTLKIYMKNISFLYSTHKNRFPKTAFLLQDETIATVDEKIDEDQQLASENSLNAINDTKIENIVWWWPSGSAFKEIVGVSEFAIMNMFKDFGFNDIASTARIEHKQVTSDEEVLKDYIEIVLSLNDKRYEELVAQYGNLKIHSSMDNHKKFKF